MAPFSTSLPTSAEECQKFKISPPHFEIKNVIKFLFFFSTWRKKSFIFQKIFGISKIEAVAGLIHVAIGGPVEAILVLRNYISSPSELLRHRALKFEKSAILGSHTFCLTKAKIKFYFFLKFFEWNWTNHAATLLVWYYLPRFFIISSLL